MSGRRADDWRSQKKTSPKSRVKITTTVSSFLKNPVPVKRAGVIIYTKYRGTVYFGLGLDWPSHDLTDFGGGVKKDETGPSAALREFAEESLIFEPVILDHIKDSVCVHDGVNFIVFVSVDVDLEHSVFLFDQEFERSNKKKPEVCGLIWLPLEYLGKLLGYKAKGKKERDETQHSLYSKVRHLLSDFQWVKQL